MNMNAKIYRGIVLAALLLLLGGVNYAVWEREHLLDEGQVVMLELAPVDPRSLMQGDYMALRFALAQKIRPTTIFWQEINDDGYVVVTRDERNVGTFARIYTEGETLAANESRIRYRERRNNVRIVTNAWFFQEGTGATYSGARYGELRVSPNGEALLKSMRDKDLKLLGTPLKY